MVTGPTPRKASTEASLSSGTGVVLPPPSPSASAILSAGASGPPNPFARPPPPSQQNSQSYSSNNNMDTPTSASPSRFVADGLLPSPSSFYPEWNFGGRSAGRYIVENATVRSFTQSASSTSLETTFPLFFTGATELASMNPEVQFSTGSGILHAAIVKFDGERVSAAKYRIISWGYTGKIRDPDDCFIQCMDSKYGASSARCRFRCSKESY